MFRSFLLFFLIFIVFPEKSYSGDRKDEINAIVDSLIPEEPEPLTRSFKPKKKNDLASRGIVISKPVPKTAELPSYSFVIRFEFDSHDLTSDGKDRLDILGKALNDPRLEGQRFQVAGHADGLGSSEYNQTLSEQRALAVARYLANESGIGSERLVAVGYGQSRPANPDDPGADENRRVEIINFGKAN